MSVFHRFPARLQDAIVSHLGWSSLRPVQEMAGEAILDGLNAVVLAPTAGGKTEASIFPALAMAMEQQPESVSILYIAPIKALLNNQSDRLARYADMVGLRRFVWHGDVTQSARQAFLREPTELLMTTPESLEVMLISSRVPVAKLFSDLRIVIIDEVHALAGTDRGTHLMSVIERLAALSQHDVQRAGLSATVGNPDAILDWVQGSSKRGGVVVDPPKQPASRELLVVYRNELHALARDAAKMARGRKSLFFSQSRAGSEAVAERMRNNGTTVFVHHSSVSKEEREAAEARFQHGSDACICCTSTLELGIDVGDLDRVLQLDTPDTISSFLQRMGRTGRRAGQVANTTFFCQDPMTVLQAIALIELARDGWVEPVEVHDRCWPVLVHQILAMALASGGIAPQKAWDKLTRVPDFRGISRDEFDQLIQHMTAEDYLFASAGRVSMGDKAERVYGRKNFMEMYAVFSSPEVYTVHTASGRDLGSLDQAFVDRLVEDESSFLLAGHAWLVEHVNHKERRVRVTPAPRGKKPSWGAFAPQFLGHELCQKMKQVLVEDTAYSYLHPTAAEVLESMRDELGGLLREGGTIFDGEDETLTWWSFAGGRINSTFKYALASLDGWKVVADGFAVEVRGEGVSHDSFAAALEKLASDNYWQDVATWDAIRARLPEYRLSKFQKALPEWAEREMLERFLLDGEGARAVLSVP